MNDPMEVIDLQAKARPLPGTIEHYWFESEHVGLSRTLFHRIHVPFEPFDSGLDYIEQPERTGLVVEWINLGLANPSALDGVEIAMGGTPEFEASIYLGGAHNWYQIEKLTLSQEGPHYRVAVSGTVEFAREGVARNEWFAFEGMVVDGGGGTAA